MRAASALACAGLCAASLSCGAPQSSRAAELRVSCLVPCLVSVNGVATARASFPVTVQVPPGPWRVTVEADGYLTQRFEIEARAGQPVDLNLQLWPALHPLDAVPEAGDVIQRLLNGPLP